jgi:hypothetical protein
MTTNDDGWEVREETQQCHVRQGNEPPSAQHEAMMMWHINRRAALSDGNSVVPSLGKQTPPSP